MALFELHYTAFLLEYAALENVLKDRADMDIHYLLVNILRAAFYQTSYWQNGNFLGVGQLYHKSPKEAQQ